MVNKYLEFCLTLVSQQQHFSISLTVGSSFSFSLDNRKESTNLETRKVTSLKKQMPRKKLSPSQVRRNLKRKQDFLKRKSEHSERESSALKVITFECDHCASIFKSETDWENHMESAHKVVTFECDHCECIFKSKPNLENHMDSAHKVITFECDHCESVFKSESDMKNHVDSILTKDDLMRNIEQLDGNSELQKLEEGIISFPLCPVCHMDITLCPFSPACPKDELTKWRGRASALEAEMKRSGLP